MKAPGLTFGVVCGVLTYLHSRFRGLGVPGWNVACSTAQISFFGPPWLTDSFIVQYYEHLLPPIDMFVILCYCLWRSLLSRVSQRLHLRSSGFIRMQVVFSSGRQKNSRSRRFKAFLTNKRQSKASSPTPVPITQCQLKTMQSILQEKK